MYFKLLIRHWIPVLRIIAVVLVMLQLKGRWFEAITWAAGFWTLHWLLYWCLDHLWLVFDFIDRVEDEGGRF